MFSRHGLIALGLLIFSFYAWGIFGPFIMLGALFAIMAVCKIIQFVLTPIIWYQERKAQRLARVEPTFEINIEPMSEFHAILQEAIDIGQEEKPMINVTPRVRRLSR